MVPGLPSVISVTGLAIKSSELVVATTSFPGGPTVVVGRDNEIVADLVFVSLSVSSACSDLSTGSSGSAASVVSSNTGPLVWVEVEMMENFRGLEDTVVITGATGTICSRELLGWPGPNTEIREMEGLPVVVGIWK